MSILLDMLKVTGSPLNNISFCKRYSTDNLTENGQAPLQQRGGEDHSDLGSNNDSQLPSMRPLIIIYSGDQFLKTWGKLI